MPKNVPNIVTTNFHIGYALAAERFEHEKGNTGSTNTRPARSGQWLRAGFHT